MQVPSVVQLMPSSQVAPSLALASQVPPLHSLAHGPLPAQTVPSFAFMSQLPPLHSPAQAPLPLQVLPSVSNTQASVRMEGTCSQVPAAHTVP